MSRVWQMKVLPSEKLYFKIGEVSEITGIPTYVLRYWETQFKTIRPTRTHSHQRLYRKSDLDVIAEVKKLLYEEKLTIAGAKKRILESRGMKKDQTSDKIKRDQASDEIKKNQTLDEIKRELMAIKAILDRPP